MVIISVYMPCKGLKDNRDEFADCLAQLREICRNYADTHMIILGGDFNEDLNAQRESERKTGLKNFIRESELKTIETGRTFVNADGVEISTIDYIFCSKQLIQKVVSIIRLENVATNVSDHLPLQCTIQVNLSRAIQKPASISKLQRVRWGGINQEEYETRVTDRLSSVEGGANSISCLDNKIQKLNEVLVKEAVD